MPDWNRIIVGDAFRLPSRVFNFYRDTFLVWPFLLFTIAALVNLLSVGKGHRLGLEFGGLSVLSILLARERIILIGIALGFCAVQSLVSFFLRHDWLGLAIGIPSSVLLVVLLRCMKDYKPSYDRPKGQSIATVLLGLISLGLTILAIRWVSR